MSRLPELTSFALNVRVGRRELSPRAAPTCAAHAGAQRIAAMSSTASRASGSRREKPGLRTPIAGYQGHVPGMTSLNLHGAPWRELVLQDPLLHPQTSRPNSAWQPHPRTSRPASARQPFSRARGDEAREARGNVQLRPASAAQSDRIARFQESRRMSAEMSGMHWDEFERPAFDAGAKENNYMPRMDNNWKPPIVGYGGHVPGYTSGNMHGSAWKVRTTPRPRAGSAERSIAQPLLCATKCACFLPRNVLSCPPLPHAPIPPQPP